MARVRTHHRSNFRNQADGGVVQDIGQVLLENVAYDDGGQLLSGSFMDYAMPRAANCPPIHSENNEALTPTNPLGAKGAGKAGTVGALPAVVNTAVDAVCPLGMT